MKLMAPPQLGHLPGSGGGPGTPQELDEPLQDWVRSEEEREG